MSAILNSKNAQISTFLPKSPVIVLTEYFTFSFPPKKKPEYPSFAGHIPAFPESCDFSAILCHFLQQSFELLPELRGRKEFYIPCL